MKFEAAARSAGLARLETFIPRMGKRYAAGRNFDLGPDRHKGASIFHRHALFRGGLAA